MYENPDSGGYGTPAPRCRRPWLQVSFRISETVL